MPNSRVTAIWLFAIESEFVLVTKDEDFAEWSRLRKSAPAVVRLRFGNVKKTALRTRLEPLRPEVARCLEAGETLIEVF